MILINDNGLIGDSLCMVPVMQCLAKSAHEPVYAYFANKQVRDLMPDHYGFKDLDQMPAGLSKQKVYKSHCTDAWAAGIYKYHMIQAHYAVLGMPVPTKVPRPEIVVDDKAPEYDYVIAPWSRSDQNHNKAWFEDRWHLLISSLYAEWNGAEATRINRIAIVGASDDPKPWDWAYSETAGIRYEYGKDLRYVAGVMTKARKAVITIDNGMSHLAYAAGAKNHVLLYPACLPPQWVASPEAMIIRKEPRDITVDDVLAAVRSVRLTTA